MSSIDYRPITSVEFDAFVRAFNHAYSDYYTPVMMTGHAFRALIARDDLNLEASVVATEDEKIIGTGLLGVRGETAWIGGMGVIPERRREGIGRQMMHYLIERAKEQHITTLYLEVIEANTGAYALYRKLGFSEGRYLHILQREPHTPPNSATYHVTEDDPAEMLAYYAAFHDSRNCWQRSRPSLIGLAPQAQALSVSTATGLAAYAFGWFMPYEARIADLAVDPGLADQRLPIAMALLTHIHSQHRRAIGNAYNVSEDDPLLPAYQATGYTTDFRQIEMTLPLAVV